MNLIDCKNKYCSSFEYCKMDCHKKCIQDTIRKCKHRKLFETEIGSVEIIESVEFIALLKNIQLNEKKGGKNGSVI